MTGHGHDPAGGLVLLVVVAAALAYEAAATRAGREWPRWRAVLFLLGCGLLIVAWAPGTMPWPGGDFRAHMLQHLLIGMLAPLALVLGAPVTLILRIVPRAAGRGIGRLLRSRPVHVLAHPVVATVLNLGGPALLYLTPLYGVTVREPAVHLLVQIHFLLAGYLFAWVVAGPDPAPRRPSVTARLVVLGVAIVFHSTVSQLIYAGALIDLPIPAAQRQTGAELMYYGGDIAELLLAVALVTRRRARRRRPATTRVTWQTA